MAAVSPIVTEPVGPCAFPLRYFNFKTNDNPITKVRDAKFVPSSYGLYSRCC
jgi:hypothetical protein